MKYYVCFQNCIEDYFSENAPSLAFDSFDAAIRYLVGIDVNSDIMAPEVKGEVRWYFACCTKTGEWLNPDPEVDRVDLYQIINIIPGYRDPMYISDCYCDDAEAIVSMRRTYTLDCQGNCHDVCIDEIEYISWDKDE